MLVAATLVVLLGFVAGQEQVIFYCGFESGSCGLNTALDPLSNTYAWQISNTKTPSQNTGPSAAYNGSYFIFFLSSLPNNINSSSLPLTLTLSPSTSSSSVRVKFALHAYGSAIQSFDIRFYNGNNVLLKDDQLLTSQLQTSSTAPWVVIDNTYTFTSTVITIQFVVFCTPYQYQANIALDDLTVYSEGNTQGTCGTCSTNGQCVAINGVQQCVCLTGFTGNGYTCSANCPSPCDSVKAQCVVSGGVPSCQCLSQYGTGSGLASDPNSCIIIINTCNTCSVNAQCMIANGVQQCVCLSGYTGNGVTCTAVPTGCNGNTCSVNAQCMVVNNVQQCVCLSGYTGNGITCTASNLCGSVQCSPYADCLTQFGLPVCVCRAGYNCGATCVTQGLCSNYASCSVVNGLETCTCAPEYSGDGLSAPGSTGCISKCALAGCPMFSSCTLNSAYVASCQCNSGFVSSNGACVDINECLIAGWCRGANTYCLNTIGGYSCECQPNYLVNASTSGQDRSCPTFQQCSIGKTCNCSNIVSPTSVPSTTFFYGINDANSITAMQFLDIWSDANLKAYCKSAMCDQSTLGDIIANITIYVSRADMMRNNSMLAMQQTRDFINCNPYNALEPAWWNLYEDLSSQYIIFKQVRKDLDMKLTYMREESRRCDITNADWFRKYLEWLSPVKF